MGMVQYRYRLVGNGVLKQKFNPEFQGNYKGNKGKNVKKKLKIIF